MARVPWGGCQRTDNLLRPKDPRVAEATADGSWHMVPSWAKMTLTGLVTVPIALEVACEHLPFVC
jgi:hypothetical protein